MGKRKTLPTWLTAGERRRLLKAEMSPRDRAIITVFLFAGLRSNELRMLDVDDVDFEAMSLLVRFAKRAKQRLIPLHAEVAVALEAHLAGRSSGPVFLSSRRQRLSNRRLRSLVKALGQRAGLRKPLHPHALRHSFAVGLADAGRELDEIQELLGHENIETTVIYTHCSVERKRAAIDSL